MRITAAQAITKSPRGLWMRVGPIATGSFCQLLREHADRQLAEVRPVKDLEGAWTHVLHLARSSYLVRLEVTP